MQRQLEVGTSNSLWSSVGYCSEVESGKYSSGQAQANTHSICMASTVVTEWGSITSFGTNDGVVYAGTQNGTILVIMYNEKGTGPNCLVPVAQLTCRGPVKALLVVQDNRAYTAHHDNKVRVWRKQPRFKFLKALPTAKDHIRKWMDSFHQSFVETNTKRLHSRIRPWMEHFDAVTSLALEGGGEDEDQGVLYSGSWDKTVKVWRLSDLRCLESINAHDDAVNTLTTARNGILFTGSADGTIKVWKRTPTTSLPASRRSHHQHITTLSCHSQGHVDNDNSAVNCVVLSPDESILYCGTSKGEINYWRMDKGNSLNMCNEDALCGHERSVLCLTTLKKFVCSGSADTTIRVWVREATSPGSGSFRHSCLQVLEGHRGPVKCITAVPESLSSFSTSLSSSPSNNSSSSSQYHNSFSSSQYRNLTRNGFVVYSGSLDATVKLWWVFYDGKHYERSWMS